MSYVGPVTSAVVAKRGPVHAETFAEAQERLGNIHERQILIVILYFSFVLSVESLFCCCFSLTIYE
jgi:hypothetical protein